MTYSIQITGSKNVESDEAARELENATLEAAREFVASLEGVTSAYFYGGLIGGVSLETTETGNPAVVDEQASTTTANVPGTTTPPTPAAPPAPGSPPRPPLEGV